MLTISRDCVPGIRAKLDDALRIIGCHKRDRTFILFGVERLLRDRGQQRDAVQRPADHAGFIRRRRQYRTCGVNQRRRNPRTAAEIAMIFDIQFRLIPATITASESSRMGIHRIGRHHDRPVGGDREQEIADDEVTGIARFLQIIACAQIETDEAWPRRALHVAVAADNHQAADPGQVDRQAFAQDIRSCGRRLPPKLGYRPPTSALSRLKK